MKNLLLHENSRRSAEAFVNDPTHALLITGDAGSGKAVLARRIAKVLLGLVSDEQLQNYPYFNHLKRAEGKQDIPIDSIRSLTKMLRLKVPGERIIRRVVLIENAQDLNEEASNALLKMLEEPAANCVFLLTATSSQNLLPTIISRAQQLQVRPVSLGLSLKFLEADFNKNEVESAWRLSQGGAGLMLAILDDDKVHPLKVAIDEAKQYLHKSSYERSLDVDSLGRDKPKLALLLEALVKLLNAVQHSGPTASNHQQQRKLLLSRKLVLRLQKALDANVSPKLIALELSLKLL